MATKRSISIRPLYDDELLGRAVAHMTGASKFWLAFLACLLARACGR